MNQVSSFITIYIQPEIWDLYEYKISMQYFSFSGSRVHSDGLRQTEKRVGMSFWYLFSIKRTYRMWKSQHWTPGESTGKSFVLSRSSQIYPMLHSSSWCWERKVFQFFFADRKIHLGSTNIYQKVKMWQRWAMNILWSSSSGWCVCAVDVSINSNYYYERLLKQQKIFAFP